MDLTTTWDRNTKEKRERQRLDCWLSKCSAILLGGILRPFIYMFGQIYLEYSTEFSQIPQGSTRFHVLPFPSIPFYGFPWYSMRSGECSVRFREVPGRFRGLLRSSVAFSGVSRAFGVRGDDSAAYVTLMRSSLGKPEGIYIVPKYK